MHSNLSTPNETVQGQLNSECQQMQLSTVSPNGTRKPCGPTEEDLPAVQFRNYHP
ncbi:hypothetical protein K0M31_016647, partial [Melipona bicolor]